MTVLADTSVFIAREQGRTAANAEIDDAVAVSVVTVAELRLGALLAADIETRATRLATLRVAETLEPLPVDDRVGERWSQLVATLRTAGRRMPINDSWIAATALAHGLPVVTRDADYDDVPGLEIVRI